MHSNVFVRKVISGKTQILTEYEAAIASSEDVTPTHFVKKRRNFFTGLFNKKSIKKHSRSEEDILRKADKKPFFKLNIMQRIRNVSAKKSSKLSHKRHTPEGANLSVSETSLLDIEPNDTNDNANTLKTDNNQQSTSDSTTTTATCIQPQSRIALRNEIQPTIDKEEEAILVKSDSALLKTFDTFWSSSPPTGSQSQSNADEQHMKDTPHSSTSEVSITTVSVAPVLCDPKIKPQSDSKGALQTVITTTSHLQHTRQRQVKTEPLPTIIAYDKRDVNRFANDHNKSVVKDGDNKDVDRGSSISNTSDELVGTNSKDSAKRLSRIHFQLDPKESNMSALASEKREHLYKILVIGELGTGKTSFIKRYVHQFFSQNYRATIGVDFALKVLNWDQNTIIRLQLWDIAGQERFGNMTRVYYKEAVGAFIVFDVTRSATFDAVVKWKQDLDSKVQLPNGSPIPCILLANKCDQPKQGLISQAQKMDEYVKQNGFAGWFETSAKENLYIEEAARALVNNILLNDKMINADEIVDADKFGLAADPRPKKNCAC